MNFPLRSKTKTVKHSSSLVVGLPPVSAARALALAAASVASPAAAAGVPSASAPASPCAAAGDDGVLLCHDPAMGKDMSYGHHGKEMHYISLPLSEIQEQLK